jgi:hypothetical protein
MLWFILLSTGVLANGPESEPGHEAQENHQRND